MRLSLVVAALLFAGALYFPCGAQENGTVDTGRVSGRTRHGISGDGLPKVTLILQRTGDSPAADFAASYSTQSDSEGRFVFPAVEAGSYRLRAKRNGFLELEFGAREPRTPGAILHVDGNAKFEDLDFRLSPQAALGGRVLDPDGEPLRARIELLRQGYQRGKLGFTFASLGWADDRGEFRVAGLSAGTYCVFVDPEDDTRPGSQHAVAFAGTFYPNSRDATGATPLVLAPGMDLSLGDIVLRPVTAVQVAGRVLAPEGPQSVRSVVIRPDQGYDRVGSPYSRLFPAKIAPDGSFVVHNVPAGTYVASASASTGRSTSHGNTSIVVMDGNVEKVEIMVPSPVSLEGVVRYSGKRPAADFSPRIVLVWGGPENPSGKEDPRARTGEDGRFVFRDVMPGRYGIAVENLPGGYYVSAVRSGAVDVIREGLNVAGGTPPLEVLLKPGAAMIGGSVVHPQSEVPLPGANVVLIPVEPERRNLPALVHEAVTNARGEYSFASVPPGEYSLYAWEYVESTAWLDPAFIARFAGDRQTLSVSEGDRAGIPLSAIPLAGQ